MASSAARASLATQTLDFFLPATGAQFTVGAQLAGRIGAIRSVIYSRCMARSRFRVPVTSAAAATADFFDNVDFPDLARISESGQLDPGLLFRVKAQSAPAGQAHPYQSASTRCNAASVQPFRELLTAGGDLGQAWQAIVTRIQSSSQVMAQVAGFSGCVQQHGTPNADAGSFSGFLAWVTGQEASAASQTARLAMDRHWGGVFVSCAAATVRLQERLQSAEQAAYLRAHASEVSAMEMLSARLFGHLQQAYGVPPAR